MKKSFNVSCSVSTNNKGVSMKKSKLIINDLFSEMAALYYTPSFGVVSNSEQFSSDDWTVDTEEFLVNQMDLQVTEDMTPEEVKEVQEVKEKALVYAKATLVSEGVDIKSMDDEMIQLLAAQNLDLAQASNSFLKSDNRNVYVTVQRLSSGGNWYNVKDSKGKVTFCFDVEAIFDLDESGNIESFKQDEFGENTLIKGMKQLGYLTHHMISYVNKETQDLVVKFLDQRFLISSVLFTNGLVLEGIRVSSSVAAFNHVVRSFELVVNNMEIDLGCFPKVPFFYKAQSEIVVPRYVSHAYDSIVDFGNGIALLPSDLDVSNADLEDQQFDEGIITGSGVSTKSMMTNDMQKQDLAANRQEEANLKKVAKQTKIRDAFKKEVIKLNYNKTLNSEVGDLVHELVVDSHSKDKEVLASVINRLEMNKDRLLEIKKAATAYRALNGKGLEYKVWTILVKMLDTDVRKEIAAKVDMAIVENISKLNKGVSTLSNFSDAQVVEMYITALKYRKSNPACGIDAKLYRDVQARACKATGFKAPSEFTNKEDLSDILKQMSKKVSV